MNLRTILVLVVLVLGVCPIEQKHLLAEIGWNIAQTSPDFQALYLDSGSGLEESVHWYDESNSGADFYVVSMCAMWCAPCQQYAADSQSIVDSLADQGIQVEIYDWIFEDVSSIEPDAMDAQLWIDNLWTADSENVWFGGDIPLSSANSVINEIFTAHSSNGGFAIPNILILDQNFTVLDQFDGYSPEAIEFSVQNLASQSVPEPTSFFGGVVLLICSLFSRRRATGV